MALSLQEFSERLSSSEAAASAARAAAGDGTAADAPAADVGCYVERASEPVSLFDEQDDEAEASAAAAQVPVPTAEAAGAARGVPHPEARGLVFPQRQAQAAFRWSESTEATPDAAGKCFSAYMPVCCTCCVLMMLPQGARGCRMWMRILRRSRLCRSRRCSYRSRAACLHRTRKKRRSGECSHQYYIRVLGF